MFSWNVQKCCGFSQIIYLFIYFAKWASVSNVALIVWVITKGAMFPLSICYERVRTIICQILSFQDFSIFMHQVLVELIFSDDAAAYFPGKRSSTIFRIYTRDCKELNSAWSNKIARPHQELLTWEFFYSLWWLHWIWSSFIRVELVIIRPQKLNVSRCSQSVEIHFIPILKYFNKTMISSSPHLLHFD